MTVTDTPVKMIQLAHPRSGIGAQEFHDHWRHPHATLVRDIRPIRHYVQNHRLASPGFPDSDSTHLGIAEVWFDSVASSGALASDPQYVEHVGPDEPEFVDQSKHLITITTEEIVQTNRSDVAPDASAGDLFWSDKDAPTYIALWQFVRDRAATWDRDESIGLARALGAFRHVVNRSVDADSEIAVVRQFLWPSLTVFERAVAKSPAAFETLRQTPDSFLFLARAERIF